MYDSTRASPRLRDPRSHLATFVVQRRDVRSGLPTIFQKSMETSVSLVLYAHPFSSYCQKVLIALYENATPFELRMLSPDNPSAGAEFAQLWPLRRMPVLLDGQQLLIATTVII